MNDHVPLAPSKNTIRSDDPVFAPISHEPRRQEKRSSKLLVYVLAVIVILCAAVLVFALVVMRPTSPRARLGLVAVRNLAYGNSSSSSSSSTSHFSFNISLDAKMTIKNENFGRFDFDYAAARFLYNGVTVGEAELGRGHVRARSTTRVNVAVEIRSAGLPSEVSRNLSGDILSSDGILKLSSYAELRGRVHLIKIVKKRTALMNCSMSLHVRNRSIEKLVCA